MKNYTIHFICFFALLISSCSKEPVHARYGYEGNQRGQERYVKKLANGNYISQEDSWDKKLEAKKNHFHNILKREYLDFANKLNMDKEYSDATYFRRKGLDAERANFDVMPENPAKWEVKDRLELEDLREARLKLIDSLVGYTPIVDPAKSADAIVSYDCWVQQAQTKRSQHNKVNCMQNFRDNYASLAEISADIRDKDIETIIEKYKWIKLEKPRPKEPKTGLAYIMDTVVMNGEKLIAARKEVAKTPSVSVQEVKKESKTFIATQEVSKPAVVEQAQKATPEKAPETAKEVTPAKAEEKAAESKPLIPEQTDKSPDILYIAYFDRATEALKDVSKKELDKTIYQIKKNNPKSISVNGHTDRSYNASTALLTSKKMADAVRDYLVSKGLNKNIIKTYGFGKTDNRVENKEGEEKEENNRIEIIFKGTSS
jgi:outer membrane protein OmpA-like peptidoglycan-associated protein